MEQACADPGRPGSSNCRRRIRQLSISRPHVAETTLVRPTGYRGRIGIGHHPLQLLQKPGITIECIRADKCVRDRLHSIFGGPRPESRTIRRFGTGRRTSGATEQIRWPRGTPHLAETTPLPPADDRAGIGIGHHPLQLLQEPGIAIESIRVAKCRRDRLNSISGGPRPESRSVQCFGSRRRTSGST